MYANSYYKLKAPLKNDCKSAIIDSTSKTIYEISQMALEDDNKIMVEFLSKNADKIIERVLKK